ncbi:MAG: hypothetical protein KGM99_00970 [Burkholderiales bacterium]|nr:hypothetical protein [Burkholderiales bacterium]
MNIKDFGRLFYSTTSQISIIIRLSRYASKFGILGKFLSILLDNALLHLYGIELSSRTLDIKNLIVGHSTGVVLGGNGIRCTGTLRISSGVVFGRRYDSSKPIEQNGVFFDVDGDLTIGSNSVLLGPLKIKGPVTIGALSLVTHDITEPGNYVGIPVRKLA